MTKAELKQAVDNFYKNASVKDQKWIYNYFTDHDEFPVITDEYRLPARPLVSGEGVWGTGEEVPF